MLYLSTCVSRLVTRILRGLASIKHFTLFPAILPLVAALSSTPTHAATPPEDRADVLYHAYDGGGVTIDGPSVLVRKSYKEKASFYANAYVDMVSSASIDVMTQGSPYSEQRNEYSVGVDYFVDRATISAGFTNSAEDDYIANTGNFGVSQAFFGDLTTLSMGYVYGDNTVKRNDHSTGESNEVGEATSRRFKLGLSQILTKSWIMELISETVVDDGFLNNPYRQVRSLLSDGSVQWNFENYPKTRNSDTYALRTAYYLPYRAAVRFEGRYFTDSWGINAQNFELRYTHPWQDKFIFEIKVRHYAQTQADFYQDTFAYPDPAFGTDEAEFRARDKELSDYTSLNLGLGVTYDLGMQWRFLNKQTVSLYVDNMRFDYNNFRNALLSEDGSYAPGDEPMYDFSANVIRLFYSAYY